MHLCCQLAGGSQPVVGQVPSLLDDDQDLLKQIEITFLAGKSQRMFAEEWNDHFREFRAIVHLEPITKVVIWSSITLNVDIADSKKVAECAEDGPIGGPEFQAELGFYFRSAALRLIEVNGKAAFTIDESDHIVGSQHQVSPFRRIAPPYYGIS